MALGQLRAGSKQLEPIGSTPSAQTCLLKCNQGRQHPKWCQHAPGELQYVNSTYILYPFCKFVSPSIHYGFEPNSHMMAGMRFPPPIPGPIPISPNEKIELDEHGDVNWKLAWLQELGSLDSTADHSRTGEDPEWYRTMLFHIRSALMPSPSPLAPDVVVKIAWLHCVSF
jgi:hypothetical protein